VAVILKPLIDLHGEPKNWATSAPLYVKALADIPPEILSIAVDHAIAFNPYFPKPAELRASVLEELKGYRRRRDEAALRASALPAPEPAPPPSAEEKAYVDELMKTIRANLAEHSAVIKGPEWCEA